MMPARKGRQKTGGKHVEQTGKPTAQPRPEQQQHEQDDAAKQAYVEALIASGQAAKPDSEGKLPPGATHEIIETEDGHTDVVRRRFSAY